jgi:DNA primase
MSVKCNILGHEIVAVRVQGKWEAQIDPSTRKMDLPYDLRSTYVCADLVTVLWVVQNDILEFHIPDHHLI